MSHRLGKDGCRGYSQALLHAVRQMVAKHFDVREPEVTSAAGVKVGLLKAWLLASSDPDVVVADWLVDGCPLGDACPIPTSGVFPAMTGPSKAVVKSAHFGMLADLCFDEVAHSNYKSFEEAGQLASAEVDRLVGKGFAEYFADWQAISSRWPQARATKAAVIVKTKLDGATKVRFVLDFLRSGINGKLAVPEK
eukprot:5380518-Amphidinium_carterae.1